MSHLASHLTFLNVNVPTTCDNIETCLAIKNYGSIPNLLRIFSWPRVVVDLNTRGSW